MKSLPVVKKLHIILSFFFVVSISILLLIFLFTSSSNQNFFSPTPAQAADSSTEFVCSAANTFSDNFANQQYINDGSIQDVTINGRVNGLYAYSTSSGSQSDEVNSPGVRIRNYYDSLRSDARYDGSALRNGWFVVTNPAFGFDSDGDGDNETYTSSVSVESVGTVLDSYTYRRYTTGSNLQQTSITTDIPFREGSSLGTSNAGNFRIRYQYKPEQYTGGFALPAVGIGYVADGNLPAYDIYSGGGEFLRTEGGNKPITFGYFAPTTDFNSAELNWYWNSLNGSGILNLARTSSSGDTKSVSSGSFLSSRDAFRSIYFLGEHQVVGGDEKLARYKVIIKDLRVDWATYGKVDSVIIRRDVNGKYGIFNANANASGGTTVSYSIINPDTNAVVKSNVAPGSDLNAFPELSGLTRIRLRAELTRPSVDTPTPYLGGWSLNCIDPAPPTSTPIPAAKCEDVIWSGNTRPSDVAGINNIDNATISSGSKKLTVFSNSTYSGRSVKYDIFRIQDINSGVYTPVVSVISTVGSNGQSTYDFTYDFLSGILPDDREFQINVTVDGSSWSVPCVAKIQLNPRCSDVVWQGNTVPNTVVGKNAINSTTLFPSKSATLVVYAENSSSSPRKVTFNLLQGNDVFDGPPYTVVSTIDSNFDGLGNAYYTIDYDTLNSLRGSSTTVQINVSIEGYGESVPCIARIDIHIPPRCVGMLWETTPPNSGPAKSIKIGATSSSRRIDYSATSGDSSYIVDYYVYASSGVSEFEVALLRKQGVLSTSTISISYNYGELRGAASSSSRFRIVGIIRGQAFDPNCEVIVDLDLPKCQNLTLQVPFTSGNKASIINGDPHRGRYNSQNDVFSLTVNISPSNTSGIAYLGLTNYYTSGYSTPPPIFQINFNNGVGTLNLPISTYINYFQGPIDIYVTTFSIDSLSYGSGGAPCLVNIEYRPDEPILDSVFIKCTAQGDPYKLDFTIDASISSLINNSSTGTVNELYILALPISNPSGTIDTASPYNVSDATGVGWKLGSTTSGLRSYGAGWAPVSNGSLIDGGTRIASSSYSVTGIRTKWNFSLSFDPNSSYYTNFFRKRDLNNSGFYFVIAMVGSNGQVALGQDDYVIIPFFECIDPFFVTKGGDFKSIDGGSALYGNNFRYSDTLNSPVINNPRNYDSQTPLSIPSSDYSYEVLHPITGGNGRTSRQGVPALGTSFNTIFGTFKGVESSKIIDDFASELSRFSDRGGVCTEFENEYIKVICISSLTGGNLNLTNYSGTVSSPDKVLVLAVDSINNMRVYDAVNAPSNIVVWCRTANCNMTIYAPEGFAFNSIAVSGNRVINPNSSNYAGKTRLYLNYSSSGGNAGRVVTLGVTADKINQVNLYKMGIITTGMVYKQSDSTDTAVVEGFIISKGIVAARNKDAFKGRDMTLPFLVIDFDARPYVIFRSIFNDYSSRINRNYIGL